MQSDLGKLFIGQGNHVGNNTNELLGYLGSFGFTCLTPLANSNVTSMHGSTTSFVPPYKPAYHGNYCSVKQLVLPPCLVQQYVLGLRVRPPRLVQLAQPNTTTGHPVAQPVNTRTAVLSGQSTTLPHAFNTKTLHDPVFGAWNMDTGNLYPVTAPSPIPHAFLVSQHVWNQRLGHPGGEVLRRLVFSNFISCNKEKPPILCHAYQLGKHVRLPFVSSSIVISSCFDVIHSDV
ncbi:ribonuclease H-like domain-containing protein [Tanacetum coccineum]